MTLFSGYSQSPSVCLQPSTQISEYYRKKNVFAEVLKLYDKKFDTKTRKDIISSFLVVKLYCYLTRAFFRRMCLRTRMRGWENCWSIYATIQMSRTFLLVFGVREASGW